MFQETACFQFLFLKFNVVIEEIPQTVFTVGNAARTHDNETITNKENIYSVVVENIFINMDKLKCQNMTINHCYHIATKYDRGCCTSILTSVC